VQPTPELDLSTALRRGRPHCFPDAISTSGSPEIPTKVLSDAETLLPLRVIDIGNAELPQQVRLHIRTPNERGHYATLSHRWGDKVPLKTTRRTLKRHLKFLETQSLPQTFQDAITVTHLLGIRYLWIDALCIIQDDHQDWVDQAAAMGSIYQHSLVTIAIHSAKNSLDGFL
jgi:hypothetical protein